jgi:hypothetical protein
MKTLFKEISNLNDTVQNHIKVAESTEDWETAYDLIFNEYCSRRFFNLVKQLGMGFDYYDPDTTYEEDARAFANAMNDWVNAKRPFFQSEG